MEIGNRIIFDQDGEIVLQFGEMQGDVLPRKGITSLDFIDLEFGQVNHLTHKIIGVDTSTKQLILEALPHIETEVERLERENAELAYQLMMGGLL